jgi:hypothetical protein
MLFVWARHEAGDAASPRGHRLSAKLDIAGASGDAIASEASVAAASLVRASAAASEPVPGATEASSSAARLGGRSAGVGAGGGSSQLRSQAVAAIDDNAAAPATAIERSGRRPVERASPRAFVADTASATCRVVRTSLGPRYGVREDRDSPVVRTLGASTVRRPSSFVHGQGSRPRRSQSLLLEHPVRPANYSGTPPRWRRLAPDEHPRRL